MKGQDFLYFLEKDTKHLPKSSFYLGLADILTTEAERIFKNNFGKISRTTAIKEAQEGLQQAINFFNDDKNNYLEPQKQGFLKRKLLIDLKLKSLEKKHQELLLKETLSL